MMTSLHLKRTIEKHKIESAMFPEGREIKVFLPPDFNPEISYPCLICHDGEDFLSMGRVATFATQFILNGQMEPIIIIFVEVDKKNRTEQFHPTGSRFSDYLYFFVEEMLPFIEEHYPVKKEASEWVIAGDSLAGTVSLHLALQYPEIFNKIICLSGALEPHTQLAVAMHNDLSWLEFWMTIGLEEDEVTTERGSFDFLAWNRETKELLKERHVQLVYREKPGRHVWGFWQQEIPYALLHFFGKKQGIN